MKHISDFELQAAARQRNRKILFIRVEKGFSELLRVPLKLVFPIILFFLFFMLWQNKNQLLFLFGTETNELLSVVFESVLSIFLFYLVFCYLFLFASDWYSEKSKGNRARVNSYRFC